ncbi:serine/threonine receptor-like kinase NFP [Musa acuminata AAA Group]|uniref:(wild Malaysian banana) hypothetical protein n=1 Tax=Musa acuminata subsp. malaccensis TaxID=214687 RepID=A0A804HY21_MUSAM|nr:PREDICTED: serine/threonine receptor-like kinase NFP [Musa acuminata subsp. malaccensis]XP_009380296.1 PREDICTED: serine/threonine receptor-like kinase NFP [Musa acuminata subsp. malaccensis]CAG1860652.1 unnamed protein product [Musa acuminata subsp. malaccensis]
MRLAVIRTILFLSLLLLLLPPNDGQADPPDGIQCAADRGIYPCQAYALYRADATSLSQLDLASAGDLFDMSRLSIARTSNLTTTAVLQQNQPLLIPLTCSCTNYSRAYAPVPYQINSGDTFYLVSTKKFENLTLWPAVVLVNPTLVATNLTIGVIATFPISCQCLNSTTANSIAINGRMPLGLVTYVLQLSDTYSSVAASFGTDVQTLINLNGNQSAFSTIFVPLYEIPPPLLLSNASIATPPSPAPTAESPSVVVKKRNGVIAGLAIGLGVVGALWVLQMMLLAWLWRRFVSKGRWGVGEERGKSSADGLMTYSRGGEVASNDDKLINDISEWLDKYKVYKVEELMQATDDFGQSNHIKGAVYKGIIDGEVFAVKKMKWNAREELKILQKVNHSNLVKLEGFCIDNDAGTCYLIYEFVENGSLDFWLHDPAAPYKLDWRTRLRIALDLANGLQYIHQHTWPRVVHKDIKTSNVLLDAQMRAKVANFGLAKTGCNAVTTHIVGTQGYIAPEYLADGVVTAKMDVFAYGVVLLELVSGKEASSERGESLWAEAEGLLFEKSGGGGSEASIMAWMDPVLAKQSCPMESVATVMNIARDCLRRDPSKRPTMVEVAYNLSKADELFSDYSADTLSIESPDSI